MKYLSIGENVFDLDADLFSVFVVWDYLNIFQLIDVQNLYSLFFIKIALVLLEIHICYQLSNNEAFRVSQNDYLLFDGATAPEVTLKQICMLIDLIDLPSCPPVTLVLLHRLINFSNGLVVGLEVGLLN